MSRIDLLHLFVKEKTKTYEKNFYPWISAIHDISLAPGSEYAIY